MFGAFGPSPYPRHGVRLYDLAQMKQSLLLEFFRYDHLVVRQPLATIALLKLSFVLLGSHTSVAIGLDQLAILFI